MDNSQNSVWVFSSRLKINEYVLIHPEMGGKKWADQILTVYCTILYSTVPYSTGSHPPTKWNFFSLHFWMNQTISNVFPMLLEKTQNNQKKSLELAETPSPPVWKIPNFFWVFFLKASLSNRMVNNSTKLIDRSIRNPVGSLQFWRWGLL